MLVGFVLGAPVVVVGAADVPAGVVLVGLVLGAPVVVVERPEARAAVEVEVGSRAVPEGLDVGGNARCLTEARGLLLENTPAAAAAARPITRSTLSAPARRAASCARVGRLRCRARPLVPTGLRRWATGTEASSRPEALMLITARPCRCSAPLFLNCAHSSREGSTMKLAFAKRSEQRQGVWLR